jgi:hypothetical protein
MRFRALLLLMLLGTVPAGSAQSAGQLPDAGTVAVTVRDTGGQPVSNAEVFMDGVATRMLAGQMPQARCAGT